MEFNSISGSSFISMRNYLHLQLEFLPAFCTQAICESLQLKFDEAVGIIDSILQWGPVKVHYHKTTGDKMVLRDMLLELQTLKFCPIICSNPKDHIQQGRCCPLYFLYNNIGKEFLAIRNILDTTEVRNSIIEGARKKQYLLKMNLPVSSKLYFLHDIFSCFVSKKVVNRVLVADFTHLETLSKSELTVYANLLKTVGAKYEICLLPRRADKPLLYWNNFVDIQFETCKVILIVATPMLFSVYNSHANDKRQSIDVKESSCIEYFWDKVSSKSHKQVIVTYFDPCLLEFTSTIATKYCHILPKENKKVFSSLKKCTFSRTYLI